ncbi:MAG: hypothetical protein KC933_04515 [Myxococcales bacterium]|nr:hypothetical protein [Myxococcales bacterium]
MTAGEHPKGLLEVAKDILQTQGREADVVRLKRAIGGRPVAPEELDAALDAAFGVGFAAGRAPTLPLVDAVIDRHGDDMALADLGAVRRFREALDLAAEADLFGVDLAQRPLSTATADAKLAELAEHLGAGTGLDERAVFQVASVLTAALNHDARRPAVLVLAGAKGPGVDRLVTRALDLTEAEPIKIQGAADLRLDDPVGYLVGSPANEPGSAKGALVHGAQADQRFVASFSGLERVGAQLADRGERQATLQSFWSFIAHASRDAGFRGYDPDDANRARGAWVDLAGGVLVLQTSQSVAELRDSLPEAVWAQLAPSVVPMGASPRVDVVKAVETLLSEHAREASGLPDVRVELGDTARGFIEELINGGMAPETAQEVLHQQVAARLAFAAVDQGLAPKVRVDLARGITRGELTRLRQAWLEGRFVSLAGVGASPFAIYDAGAEAAQAPKALSARLAKALAQGDEVSKLRKLVAEYQRSAGLKDQDLTKLVTANDGLARRADAAEVRIDDLSFLNAQAVAEIQDLRVLNDEAKATIKGLKGDLAEANRRIEALNADLAKAKGAAVELKAALDTAVAERDEITRTLRRTEQEIDQAVRSLAENQGGDPTATFELVAASARGQQNRFVKGLLSQMHMVATGRALQLAAQHARRFDKFRDIARMADGYVRSARALGQPVDHRVMRGFEEAARLSGNGWSRNMARDWEALVGAESRHHGEDPDVLGSIARNLLRQFGIRV